MWKKIDERCCTPLYSPRCTAFGPELRCIWPTGNQGRAGLGLLVKGVDKPTTGQYVLYCLQSENSCQFCLISVRNRLWLVASSSVSLGWDKPMEKKWRWWQADRVSLESMEIMLTSFRKQPAAEMITSSLLPLPCKQRSLRACYATCYFCP